MFYPNTAFASVSSRPMGGSLLTAAAIALFGSAVGASAQDPGASPSDREASRRIHFSIAASVAGTAGGPGGFLGSLFLDRGFDDRPPQFGFGCLFCWSDGDGERVDDPRRVYVGSARMRFGGRWSVAAFANGADEAAAGGYRSPGYGLRLKASTSTTAVAVGYGLVPYLDVSVGPALYQLSVEEVGGVDRRALVDEQVLGGLLDLGAELPIWERVFVRLFGQYRWMPRTAVGPIAIPDDFHVEEPFVFEAFDLPGQHVLGGVGLGVRF